MEEEEEDNMTVSDRKQALFSTDRLVFHPSLQPPHRGPEAALPPAPYPTHSLRRLPQCPPVHLSHPVPLSLTLSLSPGPAQPRPPVPPPHIHVAPRGASFRGASRHNSCRMVMVSELETFYSMMLLTLVFFSAGPAELLTHHSYSL